MTKADAVESIATEANISKAAAEKAYDVLVETIRKALLRDGRVQVPSLGTFDLAPRAARVSRNPRTGAEIKVPKKVVVRFRAATTLRGAVSSWRDAQS